MTTYVERSAATCPNSSTFTFSLPSSTSPAPLFTLSQNTSLNDVGYLVWDAGLALAHLLPSLFPLPSQLLNTTVLDLGAGTGVSGLVAAHLGAHAILTDLPGPILDLLSSNIRANAHLLRGQCEVAPLDWTIKDHARKIREKVGRIDYILAADDIFLDGLADPLMDTIEELADERTQIVVAFRVHRITPLIKFFARAYETFDVVDVPQARLKEEFRNRGIFFKIMKKKERHGAELRDADVVKTYTLLDKMREANAESDAMKQMRRDAAQMAERATASTFARMANLQEKVQAQVQVLARLQWDVYDSVLKLKYSAESASAARHNGEQREDVEAFQQLEELQRTKAMLLEQFGFVAAMEVEVVAQMADKKSFQG